MPELPEVETIVRKLATVLPSKTIKAITPLHPKTLSGDVSQVIGQPITRVSRRAKIIRFHFANHANIIIHLKMTGQLIYVDDHVKLGGGHPTADWVSELPSKHTRVVFEFTDNAKLFFNDQRLFGWIKVVSDEEVDTAYKALGPDVIEADLKPDFLVKALKNKSVPIKVAIMDNQIWCGLGNIYACDALNLAQIHPDRPAKSLSQDEVIKVFEASRATLEKGIELGGTTFDGQYVNVDGFAGQYQSIVRVYGREGEKCLHCQGEIVKTKLGGRGTYFCSQCQV